MLYETEITISATEAKYFSIDPNSLIYDDTQMMTAEVTGFAYGSTENRAADGQLLDITHTFRFRDTAGDVVEFGIYSTSFNYQVAVQQHTAIVHYVWQYFGNRLLLQLIQAIHAGHPVHVGDCTLSHAGVYYKLQPQLYGPFTEHTIHWEELVYQPWGDAIVLLSRTGPDIRKSLSLSNDLNAHLIKAMCELIYQGRLAVNVLKGLQAP